MLRPPLLRKLRKAYLAGFHWTCVYWHAEFAWGGRTVLASAVPGQLLELLERGETPLDTVTTTLATRVSRRLDLEDFTAYKPLWEEAVTFALGVRQDVLRARACADSAWQALEEGRLWDAFLAARQAYDVEYALSGRGRYWHVFLYSLADTLVSLGHDRDHPELRRYAQARPRDPRP